MAIRAKRAATEAAAASIARATACSPLPRRTIIVRVSGTEPRTSRAVRSAAARDGKLARYRVADISISRNFEVVEVWEEPDQVPLSDLHKPRRCRL